MKKFTNVLLTIFSIGILLALFCGAASLLGYVVAMFIGGEIATEICRIILKVCMPWVIRCSSILTGIGLVGMYLSKIKALSIK